ncbi:MAG TPA: tRNA dihydrouridine(20/20a) synthase DusA [Burkholderiaceae bacterium]|nr:tRNA dihydrouridine(20/20a) synthase DusA [Burkholderiaceae bacterium]
MDPEVLGRAPSASPWRFCVAPMMDWTDRHCRFFHRQLSVRARLYTEMMTTGALLHGDAERHLRFDPAEHPLALQLGGSEPGELARAARIGADAGYDEINLNCGCPSERVQHGAFGACLMAEPELVADCIKAMQDAVSVPVTVKHRIGIDCSEDYAVVRDFVGVLHRTGCRVFIVHARNAWLKGLSPKENREVPPLRYEVVYRLKRDFPDATVVLNGGLQSLDEVLEQSRRLDGVMLGRAAYQCPFLLADVDSRCFGDSRPRPTLAHVVERMSRYLERECRAGTAPRHVVRHMLGLCHGLRGARHWRRMLSDAAFLEAGGVAVLQHAAATLRAAESRQRAAA